MGPAEEMTHLARELADSYEARISSVEQIIAGTHEMLETFRSQREAMRSRLREALARAASLRKRDFDTMMEGILARQEAREMQIKETMRDYLQEQRLLAATLKEILSAHLGRTQAEPARRDAKRAGAVEELLGGIMAKRQGREREVRFLLAESLQGMIHQELVPTVDGGQRVACEILVVTNAAKNIIRRKGGFFLRTVIETGRKHGMTTMVESLNGLFEAGIISENVAKAVSSNYE